eukprot:EG_transcript_6278
MATVEALLHTEAVDHEPVPPACEEEGVPAASRAEAWRKLLLHGTDPVDVPLDLADAVDPHIADDLQLLSSRLGGLAGDQPIPVKSLQAGVQQLCRQRALQYSSALAELCGPLVLLPLDAKDAVTLLAAITDRFLRFQFLPAEQSAKAETVQECLAGLLRLLLQYHDPLLALHLDRHRVAPAILLTYWSHDLFIRRTGLQEAHLLWDHLFLCPDAVSVLFVALALLISQRQAVLAHEDPAVITQAINDLFVQPPALTALFGDARSLLRQTPPSAIDLARQLLTVDPALDVEAVRAHIRASIVLPITTADLLEAFRVAGHRAKGALTYIVLDCRALRSFQYARLPTAVHIGPDVGYDPEKFLHMRERFDSARGSHFCVMGTGKALPEELNLLTIIAMQFVQGGFEHVAFAEGGFKACIPDIKAERVEYVREVPKEKPEPAPSASSIAVQKAAATLGDAKAYLKRGIGNMNFGALGSNLPTMKPPTVTLPSIKPPTVNLSFGGFFNRGKPAEDKAAAGLDGGAALPDFVSRPDSGPASGGSGAAAAEAKGPTSTGAPATTGKEVPTAASATDPNAFSLGEDDDEGAEFEFLEAASPAAPPATSAPKAEGTRAPPASPLCESPSPTSPTSAGRAANTEEPPAQATEPAP